MTKGLNAPILSDFEGIAKLEYLVSFELDAGTTYYTTAGRDLVWGGNTYLSGAVIMGIGPVTETDELQLHDLDIAMAGSDLSNIAIAMGQTTHRRVTVLLAVLDEADTVRPDPAAYYTGYIDGNGIKENLERGESVIKLRLSSALSNKRQHGRRTTDASHQIHSPGDLFFEFAALVYEDRVWVR